jgi:Flp pilus assembly protein TadB
MSSLTSNVVGAVLLAFAGGLMIVGAFWLKRIVRLVY